MLSRVRTDEKWPPTIKSRLREFEGVIVRQRLNECVYDSQFVSADCNYEKQLADSTYISIFAQARIS